MEWDEQTLYVSTGTILNHVDINKVSTTNDGGTSLKQSQNDFNEMN